MNLVKHAENSTMSITVLFHVYDRGKVVHDDRGQCSAKAESVSLGCTDIGGTYLRIHV